MGRFLICVAADTHNQKQRRQLRIFLGHVPAVMSTRPIAPFD